MASIVAPNEGLPDLLRYILKSAISGVFPWKLGLFVNDIEPDQALVFGDLVEPTWFDYSRKTLDRDTWTDPVIVDDHAVSEWGDLPLVWLNGSSGPDTVYGVFYLDETAGVLRLVQRFDPGDVREIGPGGQVSYLPRVTLTTEGLA